MHSLLLPAILLASMAHAISLSSVMEPHESRHCFYADVQDPKNRLHFYYSVSHTRVSTAGVVPVKLRVFGPGGEQLEEHPAKAVMETTVQPSRPGQYSFCLEHDKQPSRKVVDVDLSEQLAEGTRRAISDDKNPLGQRLEKTNDKLKHDLEDLLHTLKYIKNREKRNMETVEETNGRIWWFSIIEIILVVGMSIAQVTILRQMFGTSNRPRV